MTLREIERLEKMLKEKTQEQILTWLEREKLVKQAKNGLIDISVPHLITGEPVVVKAFPLSENLCVIGRTYGHIEGFKSFRGKVNLTHIKTGYKLRTVKISKGEALQLANDLENLLDWGFSSQEGFMKTTTKDQRNEALDLIAPYRA